MPQSKENYEQLAAQLKRKEDELRRTQSQLLLAKKDIEKYLGQQEQTKKDLDKVSDEASYLRSQLRQKEEEVHTEKLNTLQSKGELESLRIQCDQMRKDWDKAHNQVDGLLAQAWQREQRLNRIETELKIQQEKLRQANEKLSEGRLLLVFLSLLSLLASFLIGWGTNLFSADSTAVTGITLVILGAILYFIVTIAGWLVSSRASKATNENENGQQAGA